MARLFLALGAINGFLAVAFGAFGAHALKGKLDSHATEIFNTAADYQLVHALALVATGVLLQTQPGRRGYQWAGWLFLTGCVIFSGSLYALALTGMRILGAITPAGGTALLAGWLVLAVAAWRHGGRD